MPDRSPFAEPGSTQAVDGLSFDVGRGEVFGLLGPNGAGKTTTVETLEGYRNPDRGTVRVLGLDPVRDAAAVRPRIGVMLQEGGLYPGLKPLELLHLFAAYYDDPESPAALLDTVGLRDAARISVRRLSGGQKQRLSLACALIGRPEVVFLDEPTAGMDPQARASTWDLVRELRAKGTTIVLTETLPALFLLADESRQQEQDRHEAVRRPRQRDVHHGKRLFSGLREVVVRLRDWRRDVLGLMHG